MFRIAVCDDESSFLKEIECAIRDCYAHGGGSFELDCYDVPDRMLSAYENKEYDLILLDIQMGNMNGIATAKTLRERGYDRTLVFITSCREYAIEGYKVAAYRYLVKPVVQSDLIEILKYAQEEQEKHERYIVLKVEQKTIRVTYRDIIFVETYGHQLFFHTNNGIIRNRMPMREFLKQAGNDFVKIHKSYVVNLEHVKSFDTLAVETSIGEGLPVSRNYTAAFRERIAAYWGARLNG